jgi:hypothetical protein
MKKLLLIILLLAFCFNMSINAKVEFGNWNRWNERLPSWDNKSWKEVFSTIVSYPLLVGSIIWLPVNEDWQVLKIGSSSVEKDQDLFLLTRLYFVDRKAKASVVLFSSAETFRTGKTDLPIKNVGIKDCFDLAELALVVFPPEKEKIVVKAYEKSDELFLFLEEWVVPFKNNSVIFAEEKEGFKQKFQNWIEKQGIGENIQLSPRLIVRNKKEFLIGITLEVFEKEEIKATIIF